MTGEKVLSYFCDRFIIVLLNFDDQACRIFKETYF